MLEPWISTFQNGIPLYSSPNCSQDMTWWSRLLRTHLRQNTQENLTKSVPIFRCECKRTHLDFTWGLVPTNNELFVGTGPDEQQIIHRDWSRWITNYSSGQSRRITNYSSELVPTNSHIHNLYLIWRQWSLYRAHFGSFRLWRHGAESNNRPTKKSDRRIYKTINKSENKYLGLYDLSKCWRKTS